jgi:Rod binding domain-containing protein
MARKATDTIKLQLRLSERLRRRLEKAAESQERSMNSEIVGRLEASFQAEDWVAKLEAAAERALQKLTPTQRAAAATAFRAGEEAAERDFGESLKKEGEK